MEVPAPEIISSSRSTDIPAFYADWFFYRLETGFSASKAIPGKKDTARIANSSAFILIGRTGLLSDNSYRKSFPDRSRVHLFVFRLVIETERQLEQLRGLAVVLEIDVNALPVFAFGGVVQPEHFPVKRIAVVRQQLHAVIQE